MTLDIVETDDGWGSSPDGAHVTSLIDTDKVGALLLHLAAGQSVAPRRMPTAVLYYVIEGQARLRVDDEQARLKVGFLTVVPAGAVHAISAVGEMRLPALQAR